MKKDAKVLSVLLMVIMVLMTIMVFMTFTACSKKNKDKKKGIKIGDIYTFGAYEQDNNTSNGKEAIEWIVVGKDGESLCLVSKYALDCQKYNTSVAEVTWETCSLRKWLNKTFINDAFSSEEQDMILTATVTADKNPSCDTNPGNNTQDKVFLLSITEANEYFPSDNVRMCVPTDYAVARGVDTGDGNSAGGKAACRWWLRSPGSDSLNAADVDNGGSVHDGGRSVEIYSGAVRPALWITPDDMGESGTTPRQDEDRNGNNIKDIKNIEDIKIGNIYTFGAYEQNNITSNGKEAIEWVAVDKQGESVCLISKYALDCKPYNTSDTDVTWETCWIRKWLNNTFINDAFSSEEQIMIVTTTVTAEKNPNYDTNPGNNTQDKIFLLSITEAEKYLSSNDVRMCVPTYYAIARGAWTSAGNSVDGRATCWWWLRSPGNLGSYATSVDYDGSVHNDGDFALSNSGAVRPALWITLGS